MTTIEGLIQQFLDHPGVNNAWVAGCLFGTQNASSTAMLRNKHKKLAGRHFTEEELERLIEIRKEFIQSLL